MKTRVITSVVGIVALVIALFFYDTIFFNILIAGVCLIGIHEIYNAFQFGPKSSYLFWGFVPLTAIIMLSDYIRIQTWIRPVAYLFALYLAICLIANSKNINFAKIGGMTVFAGIVIYCFYSLIYLKTLLPKETYSYDAVYFVSLILGFAWGGDTCAYFAGRAFGKRKLAPVVSPNKTVEGAIGGLVGSILIGEIFTVVYIFVTGRLFNLQNIHFMYYIIIGLLGALASVLGIIGDLFASAVKRQCGIKDYGTIFPGHGGILDRFDSVMFIAPLVVMVVKGVFYYFRG
ncbi:MAG: phosphatidate cytidylyltransferase [Oscillospiraceae bacterium]